MFKLWYFLTIKEKEVLFLRALFKIGIPWQSEPEKKITKDANLQIQMAWSGITICKKKIRNDSFQICRWSSNQLIHQVFYCSSYSLYQSNVKHSSTAKAKLFWAEDPHELCIVQLAIFVPEDATGHPWISLLWADKVIVKGYKVMGFKDAFKCMQKEFFGKKWKKEWYWHYTVCTCPPLWSSRQPPRQSTWMITWLSSSSSPLSWYHDRQSGWSHDRRHHPRQDHCHDILIITQPHLPLLSHDLPQLLRAQCSGAILVENL